MGDIHERKQLKGKEHVLDYMGSTKLAANLFRAMQTEEKLRRENVRNKEHANRIYSEGNRALIGRALFVQGVNEPVGHSGFTIRARLKSASLLCVVNPNLRPACWRYAANWN